jgi:hypothetical protein
MQRAFGAPSEEEKPMRALRILPAAMLALLAAVATAEAQRVSSSMPTVGSGGGFTPQTRHPSFYFNPKDMTINKSNAWANKNKSKQQLGKGAIPCRPPNC